MKKLSTENKLGSLLERDETPEVGADAQPSLDTILSTPNGPPNTDAKDRLAELSALKTPTTAPRPSHAEMHPADVHQSTTKAPDSGLRLGFVDVSDKADKSLAEAQNTPSKAQLPAGLPKHLSSPKFHFNFGGDSALSREARKMMENVREEAARIKAQMKIERDEQDRKDDEAEDMFGTLSTAGRKIAKPKSKVGRFSDVHMAEFKKMDSIADHPSSFRAQPGYLRPTGQSLKRKGSKAGLDEPDRPRTANKPISPVKSVSTPGRHQAFKSPVKKPAADSSVGSATASPNKRARLQKSVTTSTIAQTTESATEPVRSTTKPKFGFGFSSHLFTPTKSSLAKSATTTSISSLANKASALPRSASLKNLKAATASGKSILGLETASTVPQSPPSRVFKSPAPKQQKSEPSMAGPSQSEKPLPPTPSESRGPSNIPKPTSLKSILRRHQPLYSNDPIKIAAGTHVAPPSAGPKISNHLNNLSSDGIGTPDRRMTVGNATPSMKKRVEFCPSTKDRFGHGPASPSPMKLPPAGARRPSTPHNPSNIFDSSAYILEDDIHYPQLGLESSSSPPPAPPISLPVKKIQQQNVLSRDSPDFKSIFTTLPRPTSSLGTEASTTNGRSTSSSPFKHSPSTIRRVRESGVGKFDGAQPFDSIPTMPHGLPGKKRRRESDDELDIHDDTKGTNDNEGSNRRSSVMPSVPGGFPADSPRNSDGPLAKRLKTRKFEPGSSPPPSDSASSSKENLDLDELFTNHKKPSAARKVAANSARERKQGRGFLSMSRLNLLSQPRDRK